MAASLLRAVGCTGSDDQLAEALAMYDGDVERAANHLLDRSPGAPSRPEPPKDVSPGVAFSPDAAAGLHRLLTDDNQPTLANLRYHNDLSNGDCAYHCLWQILVLCSPQSFEDAAPKETAQTASLMRQVLFDFIEERWDHRSLVSDITWCDMITMSHNTVVTDEERDTFGTWGGSSTERLQAWRNERHDMYGSPAEMTAFVEIMHEKRVPLAIRVWRRSNNRLLMSSCIAHPLDFACPCVVADVHHTGRFDTNNAHYRLMKSGSFVGGGTQSSSTAGSSWTPTPRKKKMRPATICRG